MACSLFSTVESMATPCSVKAIGAYCVPPRVSRFEVPTWYLKTAALSAPFEVTNCDLKVANYSAESTNIKSPGKRSAFRLTACLSTFV